MTLPAPAPSSQPRTHNQPVGEFLLIPAALGLIVFGVYGLCEARWRRV
jgi:hypothetical protein